MLFKLYKYLLSPIIHMLFAIFISPFAGCRFSPTCSEYFRQAVKKYGIIHGGFLGIKRIIRCHPYSHTPHLDPVP